MSEEEHDFQTLAEVREAFEAGERIEFCRIDQNCRPIDWAEVEEVSGHFHASRYRRRPRNRDFAPTDDPEKFEKAVEALQDPETCLAQAKALWGQIDWLNECESRLRNRAAELISPFSIGDVISWLPSKRAKPRRGRIEEIRPWVANYVEYAVTPIRADGTDGVRTSVYPYHEPKPTKQE